MVEYLETESVDAIRERATVVRAHLQQFDNAVSRLEPDTAYRYGRIRACLERTIAALVELVTTTRETIYVTRPSPSSPDT